MPVAIINEEQKMALFPSTEEGQGKRRARSDSGRRKTNGQSSTSAMNGSPTDNVHVTKSDLKLPLSPIVSQDGKRVPLIDIGANLASNKYKKANIPEILKRSALAGVTHIIITGTSYVSSRKALELCEEFDGTGGVVLRCTVGIHPHDATRTMDPDKPYSKTFEHSLENLIRSDLGKRYCVAVGECGLDYDRKFSKKEDQKVVFRKQLCLAQKLGKPVFLHSRAAHKDFLEMLKPFLSTIKAVAHCHTDPTVAHLQELLQAGVYIGLTGMACDERKGRFNPDIIYNPSRTFNGGDRRPLSVSKKRTTTLG
jgi:TatD DNase family protein